MMQDEAVGVSNVEYRGLYRLPVLYVDSMKDTDPIRELYGNGVYYRYMVQ